MTAAVASLLPPPTVVNDAHKVYGVAVACAVLCGITTSVVLCRLAMRLSSRALGADDYATIPALLLYVAWSVMAVYVNLAAGVGKPLWEITVAEYETWFKGIVASAWAYPVMSASIRIAIVLFYRRIFAKGVKWFGAATWLLLVLQGLYIVVYAILPAFMCHPLEKAWDLAERQQYCRDMFYFHITVALYSTSMAFDAVLLAIPLWPISKLQLPTSKKAGIAVMFALGAGASFVAAVKLAIFVTEMKDYSHIDPTFAQYQLVFSIPGQFPQYGKTFWIPSQVEPTVALIGASLPSLRPRARRHHGHARLADVELRTRRSRGTTEGGSKGGHSDRFPSSEDTDSRGKTDSSVTWSWQKDQAEVA